MATVAISYGTRTAFTQEDNLTSLANNAAKPLGEVDNSSTAALDAVVFLMMKLGASGVSASGTVELYLLEKDDATADKWTDGIDGDATSDQAASLKNARLLMVLDANANSQVVQVMFRLRDYIAACPKFWTILVLNKSGATTTATDADHDAFYTPLKETVA